MVVPMSPAATANCSSVSMPAPGRGSVGWTGARAGWAAMRRVSRIALAALRRALKPDLAGREDLLAEELRLAARALGRLTGRVDVEDILDVIFRDFCIGK